MQIVSVIIAVCKLTSADDVGEVSDVFGGRQTVVAVADNHVLFIRETSDR